MFARCFWLFIFAQLTLAPVGAAEALDVAKLSVADRLSLQKQLTAAKCYAGALDGADGPATRKAVADCPDTRPQLRIETGMHVGAIRRIGVDRACTLAATASRDKTVRLWSLPDGSAGRVLRWPIGSGDGGKTYATAVSPDGKFVAVGGWSARYERNKTEAIEIFDAAGGEIVASVGDLPDVVIHLVFSRDGRWLAAALSSGGVRVIDTATWRIVSNDEDYADEVNGAAFGPDDRLYAASYDGKIRRYAQPPGFQREAVTKSPSGRPNSIAVTADGNRLAVGIEDTPIVELYDAKTLAFQTRADTRQMDNGDLASVAWLADGRTLPAGGTYSDTNDLFPIVAFGPGGKLATPAPEARALDTIQDIQPCAEGFVASGSSAFGYYPRAVGAPAFWKSAVRADLRDARGEAFTLSADARRVRFGLAQKGAQPVLFDIKTLALRDSPKPEAGFLQPRTSGLPVAKWEDDYHPTFAGKRIALDSYERSHSLALLPANRGFALGTDFLLRGYDAKGRELWPAQAVPDTVWGVNVSADGRLIVAAYGDGTIRWHSAKTGQELLALFVQRESREWVLWTPSGYYVASTRGEDLIGWHVNRGWDQAADFFPASKFRDIYARPDIVAAALDTLDEDAAIKRANAARSAPPVETAIVDRQPPVLNVLSPANGATAVHGEARVEFSLRSPSGLAVDSLEADVDGQPPTRDIHKIDEIDADLAHCLAAALGATCKGAMTVYLPSGAHTVSLIAHAGAVTSTLARLNLVNPDPPDDKLKIKPKLYVLSIGVAHYDDSSYNLLLADKDAVDFAATIYRQKSGELYDDVEQRVIPDADVAGIRTGLQWLNAKVGPQDVVMIFFAGHGAVDENLRFYFLARDSHADRLAQTAVSGEEIMGVLGGLRGSPVLFLDACHSAASAQNSTPSAFASYNSANVVQSIVSKAPRAVIFASSDGTEPSYEDKKWGNGAFTAAVIAALTPKPGAKAGADFFGDGKITPSSLDAYVRHAVSQLTGGRQNPKMREDIDSIQYIAESLP